MMLMGPRQRRLIVVGALAAVGPPSCSPRGDGGRAPTAPVPGRRWRSKMAARARGGALPRSGSVKPLQRSIRCLINLERGEARPRPARARQGPSGVVGPLRTARSCPADQLPRAPVRRRRRVTSRPGCANGRLLRRRGDGGYVSLRTPAAALSAKAMVAQLDGDQVPPGQPSSERRSPTRSALGAVEGRCQGSLQRTTRRSWSCSAGTTAAPRATERLGEWVRCQGAGAYHRPIAGVV